MNIKYLNKHYSGLIGMYIGMVVGAQVELGPWDRDNIESIYGDFKEFSLYEKKFSSDDDINGPIFFPRALIGKKASTLSQEDFKNLWLNYIRYESGMFWWGPSTERKAYENMLSGMDGCKTGSCQVNGDVLANQIGGQIFVDCWGMLFAGDPKKASKYASIASSVSHDLNGLEGAKFMAACVSSAYINSDIKSVIKQAVEVLDVDTEYYKTVLKALDNYDTLANFQECIDVVDELGYDSNEEVGHIIPNTYVSVICLLFGDGDLCKTLSYINLSSWDSDCNGSNVGSIVGVLSGIENIDARYLEYTNDTFVTSSAIGSLNIVDVPTIAQWIENSRNQILSDEIIDDYDERNYKFDLPYSSHGFYSSSKFHAMIRPTQEKGLKVPLNMIVYGNEVMISKDVFYEPADLVDERYSPVFSPILYPGETIEFDLSFENLSSSNINYKAYLSLADGTTISLSRYETLDATNSLIVQVPNDLTSTIKSFGIMINNMDIKRDVGFGVVTINQVTISGKPDYEINFEQQNINFNSVTPFSHNQGYHYLDKYYYEHMGNETILKTVSTRDSISLAGYYFHEKYNLEYDVMIIEGNNLRVLFYAKGLNNYHAVEFKGNKSLNYICNNNGILSTTEYDFDYASNSVYRLNIINRGSEVDVLIDGQKIFDVLINDCSGLHGYGIVGVGAANIFRIALD